MLKRCRCHAKPGVIRDGHEQGGTAAAVGTADFREDALVTDEHTRLSACQGDRFEAGPGQEIPNPDGQLLEDVAGLVFIEYYMFDFASKHPEYDEAKWIDIIRKTWKKLSGRAQQFALSGGIKLPEPLVPLVQKALAPEA